MLLALLFLFCFFFSLFAVLTSESKYMHISSKYMYTIRKENLVLQRQPGLTFLSSHKRNDTQVLVAPVDQTVDFQLPLFP